MTVRVAAVPSLLPLLNAVVMMMVMVVVRPLLLLRALAVARLTGGLGLHRERAAPVVSHRALELSHIEKLELSPTISGRWL
jgi:hypothetical protein